jgi:hypothetical protein
MDDIDKLRRRFLWVGDKAISGGKYKVNWIRTTLPKDCGGLGILDLNKFATTLHLHWLWHEGTSPEKSWVGTEVPCTVKDRLLFTTCISIKLGNGHRPSFWHSAWLIGQCPKDLALLLYLKTRHKKGTLAKALEDNRWIRDLNLREGFTTAHLLQLVNLWLLISPTQLQQNEEDTISWNLTLHGKYTASSAYKVQFIGHVKTPELATIWKTWAPRNANSLRG